MTFISVLIDIGEFATLFVGGATLIFRGLLYLAKYTKTEKDDNFLTKAVAFFEKLALNVSELKNYIVVEKTTE